MALYVSAGRRFRRTVIIATVAALVALVVGWSIGRQQAPAITDRVADVQDQAELEATGLERLGIEYEQVLAGTDNLDSSVVQPLDAVREDVQATMDRAPWLTADERAALLDAMVQVRQIALDGAPLDDFNAAAVAAAALLRQELGAAPT
jgi:hypothetical protein